MDTVITSSARVPKELYIERQADRQIRRIIRDMARPGYVLVARQMGKTNLLLHTKDVLQDERNIFVYVDFSTMGDFSERECLNYLIDTAIEINIERFADVEREITNLRKSKDYNPSRMFVRELRILLKYVDKIVFALDEIDALTRRSYSDRIFSLIRGHYYANTNFPELKRATFILSGVIEPKDIIKDPNISPFNIGEKIYLNDFSYEEFYNLACNSNYLENCDDEIIERLYYWCKGQPRISWDLCIAADHSKVKTIGDVDSLVTDMYLKSFDRAPIDSIRDKIKSNKEQRDALIQLSINKGDALSDEIKSTLYLAGIINYNERIPEFKNPIMARSLEYDWLLSLHGTGLDYISVAEKSINLENDYRKAINLLINFLDTQNVNREDYIKANYLLALAYHRNFNPEESLFKIGNLRDVEITSQFYRPIQFLKACDYISLDKFEESEAILRNLLQNSPQEVDRQKIIAYIYLCATLLQSANAEKWNEAEEILQNLVKVSHEDLIKHQLLATVMYYWAGVEEKRGNDKGCVNYLDTALISAQSNEKPKLLYYKLLHTDNRIDCANELYKSLDAIKTKPETENFENPLALNTLDACLILANLMLYYPNYDVSKYLRLFLYDSKENAVIFIYGILLEKEPGLSEDFFNLIERLIKEDSWNFQSVELINLANIQIHRYGTDSISRSVISDFAGNNVSLPTESYDLFNNQIRLCIKNGRFKAALENIALFNNVADRIIDLNVPKRISISFLECISLHRSGNIPIAEERAAQLIKFIDTEVNSEDSNVIKYLADIKHIQEQMEEMLYSITSTRAALGLVKVATSKLGRNSKIRIRFKYDGHEEVVKYKQYKREIDLGLCMIIEIL